VKKVIEVLESLRGNLLCINAAGVSERRRRKAIGLVDEAIAILKSLPRWETPEQWEKRTGEKYPDRAPVWCIDNDDPADPWFLDYHENAVEDEQYYIICAVGGLVPPNDWKPEGVA
jgi:hypothetical protein